MSSGRWICIDGVEGAGKTTLTGALVPRLAAVAINEFSAAPFGAALREAVRCSPHFISHSPVGQSLVFLGDFIELFESEIAPALRDGRTVVTDRGWVSKYAYQRSVLERRLPGQEADDLLRRLLSHVPQPDLTILLEAPLPVVQQRLVARDGGCGEERLAFIAEAARHFREIAASLPDANWKAFETVRPPDELAVAAHAWIEAAGPQRDEVGGAPEAAA